MTNKTIVMRGGGQEHVAHQTAVVHKTRSPEFEPETFEFDVCSQQVRNPTEWIHKSNSEVRRPRVAQARLRVTVFDWQFSARDTNLGGFMLDLCRAGMLAFRMVISQPRLNMISFKHIRVSRRHLPGMTPGTTPGTRKCRITPHNGLY